MEFAPIAAGDQLAFERLFREHYRPLCAFARQYLKDPEQAEEKDVPQLTLLPVLQYTLRF